MLTLLHAIHTAFQRNAAFSQSLLFPVFIPLIHFKLDCSKYIKPDPVSIPSAFFSTLIFSA